MNLVYFKRFDKPMGETKFTVQGKQLILEHMDHSSLDAHITQWKSRMKKAWLISMNDLKVTTVAKVQRILVGLDRKGSEFCTLTLLFSRPEIHHGLMNKGIPQVNLDQVNPCCMFDGYNLPDDKILGLQAEHLFNGRCI